MDRETILISNPKERREKKRENFLAHSLDWQDDDDDDEESADVSGTRRQHILMAAIKLVFLTSQPVSFAPIFSLAKLIVLSANDSSQVPKSKQTYTPGWWK